MFTLMIIMHWPQFVTLAFYIPYKLNMVYIIYALQKNNNNNYLVGVAYCGSKANLEIPGNTSMLKCRPLQ